MDPFTAYLAADGYLDDLLVELPDATEVHDRLVLAPGPPRPVAWAANVWLEPERLRIESINDAARQLRSRQRNWASYPVGFHRRCALIQAKLPRFEPEPLTFPASPPQAPLGSWTLLSKDELLRSAACSSPYAHGEIRFEEDRDGPPSRAYLKLWEVFTRLQRMPKPGETCLDLGASPGGWSWVLKELGAQVTAVDKAPLAAGLESVTWRRGSAFSLDPRSEEPVDWLFSDVICYPRRLLTHVHRWIEHGFARHYVCTLKFQGETDHETARAFAAIPDSQLMHLSVNRHELTWVCLDARPQN